MCLAWLSRCFRWNKFYFKLERIWRKEGVKVDETREKKKLLLRHFWIAFIKRDQMTKKSFIYARSQVLIKKSSVFLVCYECAAGRGLLISLNGLNKDQRKLNNKFYDASLRWNRRQIIWVWIPPNSICKEVTLEISRTTSARRPTTLQPISIYLHFNFFRSLSTFF